MANVSVSHVGSVGTIPKFGTATTVPGLILDQKLEDTGKTISDLMIPGPQGPPGPTGPQGIQGPPGPMSSSGEFVLTDSISLLNKSTTGETDYFPSGKLLTLNKSTIIWANFACNARVLSSPGPCEQFPYVFNATLFAGNFGFLGGSQGPSCDGAAHFYSATTPFPMVLPAGIYSFGVTITVGQGQVWIIDNLDATLLMLLPPV